MFLSLVLPFPRYLLVRSAPCQIKLQPFRFCLYLYFSYYTVLNALSCLFVSFFPFHIPLYYDSVSMNVKLSSKCSFLFCASYIFHFVRLMNSMKSCSVRSRRCWVLNITSFANVHKTALCLLRGRIVNWGRVSRSTVIRSGLDTRL